MRCVDAYSNPKALRLHRKCVRSSKYAAAATASPARTSHRFIECHKGKTLREWIEEHGGWVHPNLAVVENAPCGSRGVVAVGSVPASETLEDPVVVVPEGLYMTSDIAVEELNSLLSAQSLPPLDKNMDPVMSLALFMAVEHKKGASSYWWPYLDALPSSPGCPWLLAPEDLRASIFQYQHIADDLEVQVKVCRGIVEQKVARTTASHGRHLDVDQQLLLWCVGQVVSRSFVDGKVLGMAPFIDMLNHNKHGPKPRFLDVDGDVFALIHPEPNTKFASLSAGEELCISYIRQCAPMTAYMNFGFVPEELLAQKQQQQHEKAKHVFA